MSNIGVVGYGRVGHAVAYGFGDSHNEYGFKGIHKVLAYDKYPKDPKEVTSLEDVVENSEFVFVILPTPFKEIKKPLHRKLVDYILTRTEESYPIFDLSIMDENIEQITKMTNGTDKIVVIKSTVLPGTTRNYAKKYPKTNFCSNPEFLREDTYLMDFVNADRHVIGADNVDAGLRVTQLYRERFPKTPIIRVNSSTAETGKYACNLFLATKVIFANVMKEVCEKDGADWEQVRRIMVADSRIGKSHLIVPGPDGDRGFGGKCFPKDLLAFIYHIKKHGLDASLFEKIWKINLRVRKNKDWEDIPWVKT